jgi:SAM-dependent methyltransferase
MPEDSLCPSCGSLSRTRRLWSVLESGYLKKNSVLLDFSPSRSLYRLLKKNKQLNYISTDLSNDFLADYRYDITNIEAADGIYDIILCHHILEHVEDDMQAMRELFRVLKNGGTCFIQTPFKEGDIYEDFSIKLPAERLKHFGQEDHVRIYSIDGLSKRLTQAGFKVDIRVFSENIPNKYGYKSSETILICTK